MPAKGPIRVLVLLLAACLLPVLTVSAHHDPQAKDVFDQAKALGMTCMPPTTEIDCTGGPAGPNENPSTVIKPVDGPLGQVITRVNAHTNGIHDFSAANRDWFATIHDVGCADSQAERIAVRGFMDELATQFEPSTSNGGTYGPLPRGECSMLGKLIYSNSQIRAPYWYWEVTSTPGSGARPTPVPTPTPTPVPTPTPTPKPTSTPTAIVTPTARPTGTPTARPTATARPTGTATGTATATATGSASLSPTPTATESALNTPEQTVLGFTFTPEPSSAAPAPAGGGNDWPGSIPSASQVSPDAKKLAGSAIGALLLLLAMGFIGELFNDTFESNYDRILAGWQKSWLGKAAKAFSGLWGGGK